MLINLLCQPKKNALPARIKHIDLTFTLFIPFIESDLQGMMGQCISFFLLEEKIINNGKELKIL